MSDVLIVGTGAMATLFTARLAGAGAQVTMLGTWQEGLQALRERGARLITADGEVHGFQVRAVDRPVDLPQARIALVLVKAWQTERVARQLHDCLSVDGLAVTLQNGLGNAEILARYLGTGRVATGVTTCGATLLEPGLARLGGEGSLVLEEHLRLDGLAGLLQAAGFEVRVVEKTDSLVWGKLVINAAINPLTALLRVANGKLLQIPAARQLMADLSREAAEVARAQGVTLPFDDPLEAAEAVASRTAANRSSMLQDVLRGAETEIDAICGAIVRKGGEKGITTPVNQCMVYLVKALKPET